MMDRVNRIKVLYEMLTGTLNLLEHEGENINTTRITGDKGRGVKWCAGEELWQYWEEE